MSRHKEIEFQLRRQFTCAPTYTGPMEHWTEAVTRLEKENTTLRADLAAKDAELCEEKSKCDGCRRVESLIEDADKKDEQILQLRKHLAGDMGKCREKGVCAQCIRQCLAETALEP